jgi:hypothetical protein
MKGLHGSLAVGSVRISSSFLNASTERPYFRFAMSFDWSINVPSHQKKVTQEIMLVHTSCTHI